LEKRKDLFGSEHLGKTLGALGKKKKLQKEGRLNERGEKLGESKKPP